MFIHERIFSYDSTFILLKIFFDNIYMCIVSFRPSSYDVCWYMCMMYVRMYVCQRQGTVQN